MGLSECNILMNRFPFVCLSQACTQNAAPEMKFKKKIVDVITFNLLRDLPFSRNGPLKLDKD